MATASSLEQAFEGQGRFRKKRESKTRISSHYQFANWAFKEGKRFAVPVGGVSKEKRAEYSLISTTIKNASTATETLIWLHFDLDYKRAAKKWRSNQMLDWQKISETLQAEVPLLFKCMTGVTRSSGGKGLGLMLSISPLELINETGDIQKLAFRLQAWVIQILNYYEMGADEGARGLKRLMPNIFQPGRMVDRDEVTEAIIQTKRPRVIQTLLYNLRFHPALKVAKKTSRSDILWPDIRVELPCARLYTDLLDSVGPWGTEQRTVQELIGLYGISKNTVYKFLGNPPAWLTVERISGEGYRLTIRPTRQLTERAYTLLETGGEGKRQGSFPAFATASISAPEHVRAGERNQWLVSLVLACKWKGIPRTDLLDALKHLVRQVPAYQSSRSLTRELTGIVRSLYHHRSFRMGSTPELILPDWFDKDISPAASKTFSQNFVMKGTCTQVLKLPCRPGSCLTTQLPSIRSELPISREILSSPGQRLAGVQGGLGPGFLSSESSVEGFNRAVEGCSLAKLENCPEISEIKHGDTEALPSGSALRAAFSRALLKSLCSMAEKSRILSEVSDLKGQAREEEMRAWITRWIGKN